MPLRYLNLLFSVVIAIAGWSVIDVSEDMTGWAIAQPEYPKDLGTEKGKTCSEIHGWWEWFDVRECRANVAISKIIDSHNAFVVRMSVSISGMGAAMLLWGGLYSLAFLLFEAMTYIRKHNLIGHKQDGGDDV